MRLHPRGPSGDRHLTDAERYAKARSRVKPRDYGTRRRLDEQAQRINAQEAREDAPVEDQPCGDCRRPIAKLGRPGLCLWCASGMVRGA